MIVPGLYGRGKQIAHLNEAFFRAARVRSNALLDRTHDIRSPGVPEAALVCRRDRAFKTLYD
ncbi:MAG: hypothetical protein OXI01_04895 [Albidovulum sp.]|nr:hypothetical protein [Albidovulum sp.]